MLKHLLIMEPSAAQAAGTLEKKESWAFTSSLQLQEGHILERRSQEATCPQDRLTLSKDSRTQSYPRQWRWSIQCLELATGGTVAFQTWPSASQAIQPQGSKAVTESQVPCL